MSKRPPRRHLRRKPGTRAAADTFIVTGGAGFVGSNLVATLLARSPRPRIIIVDSFRTGASANIIEACARHNVGPFDGGIIPESSCDIDWHALLNLHKPRALFHLGAITDTTIMDEGLMFRENVGGFRGMIHAAKESRVPLVYASSAATYGTPPHAARREAFPIDAAGNPSNPYGFSKWMMEVEHHAMTSGAGTPQHVVGLRYFNVFGPGESRKGKMASMVYQLARKLIEGQSPRLFADGSQSRDQVYIDDVVSCTIAASGIDGGRVIPGVYNVGSGVATSFNDVIVAIRAALDLPVSHFATEYFEMPAEVRAFYQDFTQADMRATATGLKWKPSWVVAEAIGRYTLELTAKP